MRRFPVFAFTLVTAVVTGCGLVVSSAMGATSAVGAQRPAAAAIGSWGSAEEVPGLGVLNVGKSATVTSVSCPSAGNCVAGGTYIDSSDNTQAFVVQETGGTWGKAEELPGILTLNTWIASLTSVSCASAGNCAAGGFYTDSSNAHQAYVVNETGGTWGTAVEVPGSAALNTGGNAGVTSVSCPSAGNCTAGGFYKNGAINPSQAFVVQETAGTWGPAREVPGSAALNTGGNAQVTSVSCGSAGNCAAGGYYQDSSSHVQTFVAQETAGAWGTAVEVPGSAALNVGGSARLTSVSCASAGNCAAGGWYTDSSSHVQVFVVNDTGGAWGSAVEVPGSAALNTGGNARVSSVSCASAGNCAAGGFYQASSSATEAFVVQETGGAWGSAVEVPGSAALNTTGNARVSSVSCGSAGTCAAGGFYQDSSSRSQAFVVDETGGIWGSAVEVPGSAALNTGGSAQAGTVSCVPAGYCAAGGSYLSTSGQQAFVDETQTVTHDTSTSLALSATTVTYGDEQVEHVSVAVTSPSGTPGGTVTVNSGSAKVCAITLTSGKGSCTLTATQFPAGTEHVTASYNGSTGFAASTSPAKTLTVSKATTKTALSLSAATVTYGHEQTERLTVAVAPPHSGTPGGKVTIKRGTTTVCTITLASAKGSCTLTAKQIPVGTYTLVATYPGSGDFTGSTSAKKTLKVVK